MIRIQHPEKGRNKPNVPFSVSRFKNALKFAYGSEKTLARIQRELEESGSSHSISYRQLLRNMETGEIDIDTLKDMCRILDVHPGYILNDETYDVCWNENSIKRVNGKPGDVFPVFSDKKIAYLLSRKDPEGRIIAPFYEYVDLEVEDAYIQTMVDLIILSFQRYSGSLMNTFNSLETDRKNELISEFISRLQHAINIITDDLWPTYDPEYFSDDEDED